MNFTLPKKAKTFSFAMIVIGVLFFAIGLFTEMGETHGQRFWSNLLVNGIFFFCIGCGALFFFALQYAAEVGWSVLIKRVYEAIMMTLPFGAVIIIISLAASSLHINHTYHWMDSTVYYKYVKADAVSNYPNLVNGGKGGHDDVSNAHDSHGEDAHHDTHSEGDSHADNGSGHGVKYEVAHLTNDKAESGAVNPHYDSILEGKSAYLNLPFFWIRTLAYIIVFILFARWFRKKSLLQDEIGGTDIHFLTMKKSAVLLVIFAVFSSSLAWDWVMSLDPHWFSTIYGWYVFSGMWVSAIIVMLLVTLYLKKLGHLKEVNENHIHDLGKWMFAISFLWSYVWFCQFMLIWYANIPEETTYFVERISGYTGLFWGVFALNLILPMLVLMSRPAKRNYGWLTIIAIILFIGHWFDVYLMVMPATVHHAWGIGFTEIGMFLLFAGLFIYYLLSNLTKAPLVVKSHPYLDESIHFHQ